MHYAIKTCTNGPQSGRTAAEKEHFYDDLRSEWNLHSVGELVLGMGDFNGHVGKQIEVRRMCMEEMELGREMWKEICC